MNRNDEQARSEQTPASPGTDLKSLREAKGLTLRDMFERTRISVTHLEAIEQGHFHLLPPPVFAKAFIKAYAKMLGVDSLKLLIRYDAYLESLKDPSQKAPEIDAVPQPPFKKIKWLLWGALVLIGLVIIVFYISSYRSNVDITKSQPSQLVQPSPEPPPPGNPVVSADAQSAAGPAQPAVQGPPAPANPPSNATQAVPETSAGANTENRRVSQQTALGPKAADDIPGLKMEAREWTWIRIKADESTPEEILLKPGDRITRSASHFMIDIGNAGGIIIDFRGKRMENLGDHGQVIHLKLP